MKSRDIFLTPIGQIFQAVELFDDGAVAGDILEGPDGQPSADGLPAAWLEIEPEHVGWLKPVSRLTAHPLAVEMAD
jgi:hypothetical protein